MTMIPSVCFAQSNNNTDTVTKIEHKLFQQTDNMFDHRLFQADVILRSQDAYTSAKLWSNPCHCYNEIDPIAPGPNHPNWMTYAFQATATIGIAQGYNLLYKHNHKKIARAFLIADVISESVAVTNNWHLISKGAPSNNVHFSNGNQTSPITSSNALTNQHNNYQHSAR